MADIYLAGRLEGDRKPNLVAIKELFPRLADQSRFVDMFAVEAALLAQLDHPNITRVKQLGRWAGVPHIVMEYVEGIDLSTLQRQCCIRGLGLPIELRMTILCELLRGLEHAHQACDHRGKPLGIVHRDVSPSNVLLDFKGRVKLCDFGIAVADSTDRVVSETIEGKASYMSPEHARGEPVDRRSDVYAAGIILWEMLSGRRLIRPTEGETRIAVAARAQVPVLLVRGLPDEGRLHRIVTKALAEQPDDRYQTVAEMLADLEGWGHLRRMIGSTDCLGGWLCEHVADMRQVRRRARQRALEFLERRAPCCINSESEASDDSSAPWSATVAQDSAEGAEDDVPTESGARLARRPRGDISEEMVAPEPGLFENHRASPLPSRRGGTTTLVELAGLLGHGAGAFLVGLAMLMALTSMGWI